MISPLGSHKFTAGAPLSAVVLAQASARYFDRAGIGAAILLTLTGMVLHWHLPRLEMSMEERMKDCNVTELEARRQLRFYRWCAQIATFAGVLVLVAVLFDLTS